MTAPPTRSRGPSHCNLNLAASSSQLWDCSASGWIQVPHHGESNSGQTVRFGPSCDDPYDIMMYRRGGR
jgi:hypothetical protein